jgi:hypothetical protein
MIGRVEPETVQLYFKLNPEGLGTKAFYMHEKSTWCPTWQQVDNASWYIGCNVGLKEKNVDLMQK